MIRRPGTDGAGGLRQLKRAGMDCYRGRGQDDIRLERIPAADYVPRRELDGRIGSGVHEAAHCRLVIDQRQRSSTGMSEKLRHRIATCSASGNCKTSQAKFRAPSRFKYREISATRMCRNRRSVGDEDLRMLTTRPGGSTWTTPPHVKGLLGNVRQGDDRTGIGVRRRRHRRQDLIDNDEDLPDGRRPKTGSLR